MRSIQRLLIITVLALATMLSYGQNTSIQPLKLGDPVPDQPLNLHIGDQERTVQLSDYKGKLLILDFWGVSCADCIAAMPHMLELQEQFKDKIQVILVTPDKKEEIDKLWKNFKSYNPRAERFINAFQRLPCVMADTMLVSLCKHFGVPTHAWIDGNQVYRAITHANTTTPENITAFLAGKKVRLADHSPLPEGFDESNPLTWFAKENGFSDRLQYYSFIMNRIDKYGVANPIIRIDSATHKMTGYAMMGNSIVNLYKRACFKGELPPDYQVLLDVKDPSRYHEDKYDEKYFEWADSNLFCYALMLPPSEPAAVYACMQQDLDRFFHVKSGFENRKIKCMVLKRTTGEDRLHTKYKHGSYDVVIGTDETKAIIQSEKMYYLVNQLQDLVNAKDRFVPVVDETGYTERIDIDVPVAEKGQEQWSIPMPVLRKALQRYGLDLVEEYRTRKVLVLRDAG